MPPRLSEPRRRRRLISLAPLIDVVFILLVFFMLATSFTDWRALPLEVPAAAAAASDERAILVEVAPAQVRLDGRAASVPEIAAVAARRAAASPDGKVHVRAVDGASLQRVMRIVDALSAAGAARVSLTAEPAS